MKPHQQQAVQPPDVPQPRPCATPDFILRLYVVAPVRMIVVFDSAPPADSVTVAGTNSARVFECLHIANMRRGTVVVLEIDGHPIPPRALARLNWFLHIAGYTRGFRAWRIAALKADAGQILWKSAAAWAALQEVLGI